MFTPKVTREPVLFFGNLTILFGLVAAAGTVGAFHEE